MSREILKDIIEDFDTEKFIRFFREKNRAFAPRKEGLIHYDDENFKYGLKLGEIKLGDAGHVLICTFEVTQSLTERSGKKAQYEKAKKILKETQSDAGIFIFYDSNGSFRFSLIYTNYRGRKRDWNNFRRFTYFVREESTNKTFLKRIGEGDFSSLEKIKDAFSVEKVTKEFYADISYWYHWAVRETQFPKDAEEIENGRNIAVIRLITRLIFIWFMRERGLVPKDLFDNETISHRLKDLSQDGSTYYQAILQNLFFATLSTKKDERKFRSETRGHKGINPDHGNDNVFRYQILFKKPDKLKEYFGEIPFLNGGLFECLDDRKDGIYIDGFTAVKKNQPNIPNFLFFSGEQKADLNADYDTKNKTYIVKGILNILSSFNFTIDENSPDDQEVALDPELLGKVFENLLASFNPETSSTARKATGSFYTPREIVDYMVTQSLKEYFKTHLKNVKELDKKLDELFAIGNEDNPFVEQDTKNIVSLINAFRIVDPAVGSGAFPMGILNKLVFILSKLDPGNSLWKEAQINAVEQNVPDPVIKQDLINQIEKKFSEKYSDSDYGRKLYLIQKCIYGVDIQQIAVEIAKLRFFISLLVDEKIDKSKENWDIEPLPNLDFKIMQGNSLVEEYEGIKLFDEKLMTSIPYEQIQKQELMESISKLGIEEIKSQESGELTPDRKRQLRLQMKDKRNSLKKLKLLQGTEKDQGQLNFRSDGKQKGEELKRLHNIFFASTQKREKDALKKRIEILEWEFIEATLKEQDRESAIREIEKFRKSNTKPFFLWKLYFSEVFQEKGGFDVVIGNPPYVQIQKFSGKQEQKDWENEEYITYTKTGDIYCLFYEKGNMLLRDNGILAFITSNKWMRARYGKKTRKYFTENTNPLILIDFGGYKVFESATVDTNILLFEKSESKNCTNACTIDKDFTENTIISDYMKKHSIKLDQLNEASWLISPKEEFDIRKRIEEIGTPLKDWDITINFGIKTGFNNAFIISGRKKDELFFADSKNSEVIGPVLRGRNINRYKADSADLWLIFIPWHFPLHNNTSISGSSVKAEAEFKRQYPDIFNHLLEYKEQLSKRNKAETGIRYEWYALQRCASTYYSEFNKEKVVWKRIGSIMRFSYSADNEYCLDSTCFTTGEKIKYLVALLNSSLCLYELLRTSPRTGTGDQIISVQALEPIHVYYPSDKEQLSFEILVDCILFAKENGLESEASVFESVIDGLVYDLYFEKEMKKANCYITDRIRNVVKPFKDNDTDDFKTEYIKTLYDFCNNDKTVYRGLIHRRNVNVVKIINGALK